MKLLEKNLEGSKDKSFDPLAAVDLMANDLRLFGQVLPETMQRVYDEELTFVAEAINLPLATEFILQEVNGEVCYFDNGEWRPYSHVFENGYRAACRDAADQEQYVFNAERALAEYNEGAALNSLLPGQSLLVLSPFPQEAYAEFGPLVLKEKGYQPERQLGFIRISEKCADGSIRIISQSIDNADPLVCSELLSYLGVNPPPKHASDILDTRLIYEQPVLIQQVVDTFDALLSQKNEGVFRAGRNIDNEINAWDFIAAQPDLVSYYFDEIKKLAVTNDGRAALEEMKNELTLGFWAALSQRLSYPKQVSTGDVGGEVKGALAGAALRHESMVGCGGMVGVSANLRQVSYETAASTIFNAAANRLTWRKGKCRIDVCPSRPGNTLVADCSVCVGCQKLYDKGKDPVKIYTSKQKPKVAAVNERRTPKPITKPKQRGRSFWYGT